MISGEIPSRPPSARFLASGRRVAVATLAVLLLASVTTAANGQSSSNRVILAPPIPTSSEAFQVRTYIGSYEVTTHSHEIVGDVITVTILNDGPSFQPNPPGISVESVGPLAPGRYTVVVYVRESITQPSTTPTGIRSIVVTPAINAVDAIEYYHPALDHYFVTASATEISALDAGVFSGWMRTGQALPGVFVSDPSTSDVQTSVSPVCRYYGLPSAGLDTHFFSASSEECAAVHALWPDRWLLETPNAFYAYLPDIASGKCPAGTMPVYRFYNHRADVNHRYTTSADVRLEMIGRGWTPEGYGAEGVAMCTP